MNEQYRNIVRDFLEGHDTDMFLAKAKQLKQTDGEGWAIGELVERVIATLKDDVP